MDDNIEKLLKLKQLFEDNKVSDSDLAKVIEVFKRNIDDALSTVEKKISDIDSQILSISKETSYSIDSLELKSKSLINKSEETSLNKIRELSMSVYKEIQSLKDSIPSIPKIPDVLPIYSKIDDLNSRLNLINIDEKASNEEVIYLQEEIEKLKKSLSDISVSSKQGTYHVSNGKAISVLNNGTLVSSNVTEFNFVNPTSISASGLGKRKVDITTGSGSGGGSIAFQDLTGLVNSSNTTFTFSSAISGKSLIKLGMSLLVEDVDYTISGTTVTYVFAPPTGSDGGVHKLISGGGTGGSTETWVFDSTPSGTVNGVNLSFTLPVSCSQVVVYADGVRVKGGGVTYTFNGTTGITFTAGNAPGSTISADYLPS